ncbi:MAG: protein kinase [Lachnospiraceae bacterium]|nr:protein kinase [Lachnospiraceae bacterium]
MSELDQNFFGSSYQVYGEIGKGGIGTIFKARHVSLQKDVVIKRVDVQGISARDNRREADILKNLRHSYLPQVFDLIQKDGVYYTVMDFIEGQSFQQLLDAGKIFTQQQVVKYGQELLEALDYLHTRNLPVLHGDIKPANVMLTPEDHICLIDFNISGYLTGQEMMTVGFTSGYAAPEQIRAIREASKRKRGNRTNEAQRVPVSPGNYDVEETTELLASADVSETGFPDGEKNNSFTEELLKSAGADETELLDDYVGDNQSESVMIDNTTARIDIRADLYSVGAFLYHLATGKKPAADPGKFIPLSSYRGFSNAFTAIVDRAMALRPEDRFSSALQMLKALQGYGRTDSRYKRLLLRQRLMFVALSAGVILCAMIASMGYNRMRAEKDAAYEEKVEILTQAREAHDETQFLQIYDEVSEERPETLDAQLQMALYLYETRRYEEAASYIADVMSGGNIDYLQKENIADMYYVSGNSLFETGDMQGAAAQFRTALSYNGEKAVYFRDLALSLAVNGNVAEAREVLEQAEAAGLLEEQMALVRGEIASGEQRFREAISDFRYCIDHTDDDYVRLRAYVLGAEVYDAMVPGVETLKEQESFLEQALTALPHEHSIIVLEKLITTEMNLYEDWGVTENADDVIEHLNMVISNGWDSLITYNNLVRYYENLEQYDKSMETCITMEQQYPDRYETYKRRARLEIRIQKTLQENDRDYAQFYQYYEKACELYDEAKASGRTDGEMSELEKEFTDVNEKGW